MRDFGRFVVGGELSYAMGDSAAFPGNDRTSTRLKLIGGLRTGRVLPYGFVGLSNLDVSGVSQFSDRVTTYGLARRSRSRQR